jgi:predicted restriction endonuclease
MVAEQNEDLFIEYLIDIGLTSHKNYKSWLRYIDEHIISIETVKLETEQDLQIIKEKIDASRNKRKSYKTEEGNNDLKSTIRQYFLFLKSNYFIYEDIIDIENTRISATKKKTLINARIGQGKYRRDVLKVWESTCPISKIKNKNFLIASHIKPWRCSIDKERLDRYNGIILTPNYDKLFDKFFISFNNDGTIIISNVLSKEDRTFFKLTENIRVDFHQKSLKYLEYHRSQLLTPEI